MIRYEKRDWRCTVTIDRPEVHNALDLPTLRELRAAFEEASWDDAVAVLVLTGAGDKAFCTGADVKEQTGFLARPQDYWKWMGVFIGALDQLKNLGKPTIARLNGITVGGGNEFNMACDLAVMVDDAYIRQVGAARGSVAAAGATQWLPLIVGDRRAREILLLCEELPARQALEWGLVNRVVPRADLDAAVDELATKLIDKLPECTRYTKQQLNFWKDLGFYQTIGHARDWLTLHAGMSETAEGMQAFVEKRHVDYAGLRERAVAGHYAEIPHGPPTRACDKCGTWGLPARLTYCGNCGATL
ncbi:MAG: enoyl-CoA hydratase/isomerase family protein [Candidatus Sericytochromatia bacterium]|nr:enoyl-CoA hydratase/isomerase family protein [Candidatus Tanganyikabacteria bacterium]